MIIFHSMILQSVGKCLVPNTEIWVFDPKFHPLVFSFHGSYYITQNNFSPTRSITSGNRTPGSRFYSDLLDTSVCIHQLVSARNCRRLTYSSFRLTHMSRNDHAVEAMAARTKTKNYYSAHNIATRVSFGT